MATSVSANITIDDVAVSASATEATATTPVCHGPITVYVNNGTDTGDIREKLATITVRVKGKDLLNTITVGAKLKLPITIGTGAEIMMFDGVVYEAAYSPVDRETIDVTLTGKDDQTALKLHGSSPSNYMTNPIWTGLPDPPGTLWRLDQGGDIRLEDSSILDFYATVAAGNAWNDHTDPPYTRWAYSYTAGSGTIGAKTGDEMFDQLKKISQMALLRYAMESGVGTFQAARFYGSLPYTIPGDYIVMDQEFTAELYTRTNIEQIATSYESRKPLPGDGPDDEFVQPKNFEEVERFGEIVRRLEFGDVWQLHKTSKRNYYPVSWGDRKRFSSPYYFVKPWYQLTDAPVRLHRMIEDPEIGPATVADMLENIFDIRRRLGDDPFIPSVAITNAAIPMPSLDLAGVIDVAELTITPRRGKSPRLDMNISLGPGDGYPAPYKHAPRPLIWADGHYAWNEATIAWNNTN